jgi:ankyrin repeat protein
MHLTAASRWVDSLGYVQRLTLTGTFAIVGDWSVMVLFPVVSSTLPCYLCNASFPQVLINLPNHSGETPLHQACLLGRSVMAAMLVQKVR